MLRCLLLLEIAPLLLLLLVLLPARARSRTPVLVVPLHSVIVEVVSWKKLFDLVLIGFEGIVGSRKVDVAEVLLQEDVVVVVDGTVEGHQDSVERNIVVHSNLVCQSNRFCLEKQVADVMTKSHLV